MNKIDSFARGEPVIDAEAILCPVPFEENEVVRLAARVPSLKGLKVGFLGNLKPNCDVLLHTTEEEVMKLGAAGTLFREKSSCSLGAEEDILEEIAGTCQAAVVALGDCGSCTSWSVHDAYELERRGIPTVTLVATPFRTLANVQRKGLGLDDLPFAIVPYPMSAVSVEEARRRAIAVRDEIVGALTARQDEAAVTGVLPPPAKAEGRFVELADTSLEGVNQALYERQWTDGLPIVPPTAERVAEMLRYTDLPADQALGKMGPRWIETTVHYVAVNAVMAGCRPEYFPVVLTAIQAALDPAFNLHGVQTTTNPCGVMVVVNGPIARELDINGGFNLFGQGWRANGTIGRAVRLCMINIGGARPVNGDMSPLGNPNKWGACIAENEGSSPWPPFHVTRGFDQQTSTVSVVAASAPQNLLEMSPSPTSIMRTMARAMTASGSNPVYFEPPPLIVIGPLQAKQLAEGGYDRASIQKFVWEHARFDLDDHDAKTQLAIRNWKPNSVKTENGKAVAYPTPKPEDICIIVAGGETGPHSAMVATFNGCEIVTRAIARKDGTPVASVKDFLGTSK